MIQLAFESAFDPFHATFRILRQLKFGAMRPVHVTRAKILDVYVAEPMRCTEIRLGPSLAKSARQAAKVQPPFYGKRPSTPALFERMSPMQDAAIQTLVFQGILNPDAFRERQLTLGAVKVPDALELRIKELNERQSSLMNFLVNDLDAIVLDGVKGLKDRTGLGEFRYDYV